MPLQLPDHASLEYLKKIAKERLTALRQRRPAAKLADAQLVVAREYGFASWRALKAELDRRNAPHVPAFADACTSGNVAALSELLAIDPGLVHARVASGRTGLHLAVDHADAVRVLLAHGADPNARDEGDNVTPLHLAAANGALESVRVLLDAGADVHGEGDWHDGGVIGWAARLGNEEVVDLLLARGARHHIFSAMALRDRDLVRRIIASDPTALARRRSRFECGQTPLHAAFAAPDGLGLLSGSPDYEMLALLIEHGADLEATDDKGRTALQVAMLRGDVEAMRLLRAAGAREPEPGDGDTEPPTRERMAALASSVQKASPMFLVPDMRATVRWYQAIGFRLEDAYEDGGELVFARLTLGHGELTLTSNSGTGPRGVSLWFFTNRVEAMYEALKAQQRRAASAASAESSAAVEVRFEEDLYTPFYGGRQFSIRDINGLTLIFWQPEWLT